MGYAPAVNDHALTASELLEDLSKTTSGLRFPSESGHPFTVFRWAAPEGSPPSGEALVRAIARPAETPVEESAGLASLFAGNTEGPGAIQFRAAAELLENNLTDLRVFRVGKGDVDVFILGRHAGGGWLGLSTKVVEK